MCIENGKKAILIRKKVSHKSPPPDRRHEYRNMGKGGIHGKFHNEKKALAVRPVDSFVLPSWGMYGKQEQKADSPDWP